MTLESITSLAERLDAQTIQTFVHTMRLIADAILAEAEDRAGEHAPTGQVDYATAGPDRTAPPGGWGDVAEIRSRATAMAEAIAAEKWQDGFVFAFELMALVGKVVPV